MIEAYKKFWNNYATFSGRATRSDFWYAYLMNCIIGFVLGFLYGITKANIFSILTSVYSLAALVPNIALAVRRLHDINKSGYYYFMGLIPIAGPIIMLVYYCTASVNENNNY